MASVPGIVKRIVLWSYGRSTWQYDVLCVLILAFVFLTPKSWFETGKLPCSPAHQNGLETVGRLVVRAPSSTLRPDAHDIERCARQMTNRTDLRVKGWREARSTDGRVVAFEIDIE